MKLLSIELFGKYKGLKDQVFHFSMAKGDVAVLIGANGSGKSQVMELIAESFTFLERVKRKIFVCGRHLDSTFASRMRWRRIATKESDVLSSTLEMVYRFRFQGRLLIQALVVPKWGLKDGAR